MNCPNCGTKLPIIRIPKSFHQAMYGGVTCKNCGAEIARNGDLISVPQQVSEKEPATAVSKSVGADTSQTKQVYNTTPNELTSKVIKYRCPNIGCGKNLSIPAQHAGKNGKCPACGQVILVPGATPIATKQQTIIQCDRCKKPFPEPELISIPNYRVCKSCDKALTKEVLGSFNVVTRITSEKTPADNLLDLMDKSSGTDGLYEMLRTHTPAQIEQLCRTYPIESLRLDWDSLQRDFQNNKRFEMITVLAQILIRYDEILTKNPELKLPSSLPGKKFGEIRGCEINCVNGHRIC